VKKDNWKDLVGSQQRLPPHSAKTTTLAARTIVDLPHSVGGVEYEIQIEGSPPLAQRPDRTPPWLNDLSNPLKQA